MLGSWGVEVVQEPSVGGRVPQHVQKAKKGISQ